MCHSNSKSDPIKYFPIIYYLKCAHPNRRCSYQKYSKQQCIFPANQSHKWIVKLESKNSCKTIRSNRDSTHSFRNIFVKLFSSKLRIQSYTTNHLSTQKEYRYQRTNQNRFLFILSKSNKTIVISD